MARELTEAEIEAIERQTDWQPVCAAYLYFLSHLWPDHSYLDEKDWEESADAMFGYCLGSPFERECPEMYDPAFSPVLLVILTLAAIDGYPLADISAKRRTRTNDYDRIPSVDLAALLDRRPRQIAQTMGWWGLSPRAVRFAGRGVTKGYLRSDVEAAWRNRFGEFLRKCRDLDRANRRSRDTETLAFLGPPAQPES